MTSDLRCP